MTPRRTRGFTMIEMLVAVAILGVVVAGAMQTFVVQNRAYTVVDETTEAQQNLRAISYLIERDVRATGFMVDEAAAVCGIDSQNSPDTLYVTDAATINPTGATTATLGAAVTSPYASAASLQWIVVDDLTLDDDAPGPPSIDFQKGGAAILFDADSHGSGTACGRIVEVENGPPARVQVLFENSIASPGSFVLVPAIRYSVEVDAQGVSKLMRNGTALASDVEDLQVAYFIDLDEDGKPKADGSEYRGSDTADYASKDTDHSKLREIRFNIVVRTRNADPTYSEGFKQATENHVPVPATEDPSYRRRVFTSTVRPRNIGYRGVQASG